MKTAELDQTLRFAVNACRGSATATELAYFIGAIAREWSNLKREQPPTDCGEEDLEE